MVGVVERALTRDPQGTRSSDTLTCRDSGAFRSAGRMQIPIGAGARCGRLHARLLLRGSCLRHPIRRKLCQLLSRHLASVMPHARTQPHEVLRIFTSSRHATDATDDRIEGAYVRPCRIGQRWCWQEGRPCHVGGRTASFPGNEHRPKQCESESMGAAVKAPSSATCSPGSAHRRQCAACRGRRLTFLPGAWLIVMGVSIRKSSLTISYALYL